MKKIFTLIAALVATLSINAVTVGNEDNTSGWWTAFSEATTVNKGEKAVAKFVNHNLGTGDNWFNWILVATKPEAGNPITSNPWEGANEYGVIRADNYGWGGYLAKQTDLQVGTASFAATYDWTDFMGLVNGAQFEVTMYQDDAGKLNINVVATKDGKSYTNDVVSNEALPTEGFGFFFTVEKAHLTDFTVSIEKQAVAATTGLSIEPLDIKAGETKEMVIDLTNPSDDITLVQFDLRLPAGLSVKQTGGEYDIDIAGRTTWRKHSLDANATNGIIRFLLASSSNATLTGTEGAVIKITITADKDFTGGDIQLENILMVTPAEKEIKQDTYTYQVGQSQPSPASTGLAVEPFSISAGGEAEMVIDLNNPDDEITLVQFDLRLPAGLSVKQTGGEYDYDIAGRTTWRKHSLDANATNGIVRFLLASSSNATLTGTEGAVIKMTLKADNTFAGGAVKLENILLVTPAEKEIKQSDVNYTIGTTGIKSVVIDNIEKNTPIYNLSGQRLDKPRKGINIIGGKKVITK